MSILQGVLFIVVGVPALIIAVWFLPVAAGELACELGFHKRFDDTPCTRCGA